MVARSYIEEYLGKHTHTEACLKDGIVNYSELTRRIMSHFGLPEDHFNAVIKAVVRHREKLNQPPPAFISLSRIGRHVFEYPLVETRL